MQLSEEEKLIKEKILDFEPKYIQKCFQKRTHKKWRTNKKWAKRYGYEYREVVNRLYLHYMFPFIDEYVSSEIIKRINRTVEQFVDIKDVELGR